MRCGRHAREQRRQVVKNVAGYDLPKLVTLALGHSRRDYASCFASIPHSPAHALVFPITAADGVESSSLCGGSEIRNWLIHSANPFFGWHFAGF